jgi:hypothetical protein
MAHRRFQPREELEEYGRTSSLPHYGNGNGNGKAARRTRQRELAEQALARRMQLRRRRHDVLSLRERAALRRLRRQRRMAAHWSSR